MNGSGGRAWRGRPVAALLLAIAALTWATGAFAANDAPDTDVTGTYVVVDASGGRGGHQEREFLKVGTTYYELSFKHATRLHPGQRARIRGHRNGNAIAVTSDAPAGAVPGSSAPSAAPAAAGAATMDRVLVILAYWTYYADSMTPATARTELFTTGNNWYQDVSYGRMGLTGDVTNWLSIPRPYNCDDVWTIKQRAEQAAVAAGFNLAAYNRTMIYFPMDRTCWWGGQATVNGNTTWINGELTDRIAFHELGHNYGLRHAHSYRCFKGSTAVVDGGSCTSSEYGDYWDAMGDAPYGVGHFNAAQKNLLGWLDSGRTATVTTNGTFTLLPYEGGAPGLRALQVRTAANTYWVEFRQPIGADSWLANWTGVTNGVLVHVPATDGGTWLFDMNPSTSYNYDAALAPGKSWTDTAGAVTLTVGSVSSAGATLSVAFASPPTSTSSTPSSTSTSTSSTTTTSTTIPTTTSTSSTSTTSTSTTSTSSTSTTIATVKRVTVTSPNGGEQWLIGQPHDIRWSVSGVPNATVTIVLLRSGQAIATLASAASTGANGQGVLSWTPSGVQPGSIYTIRITVNGVSPSLTDSSDAQFSLTR